MARSTLAAWYQPPPLSSSGIFPLLQRETTYPLAVTTIPPPPTPGSHESPLSLCGFACSEQFMQSESRNIYFGVLTLAVSTRPLVSGRAFVGPSLFWQPGLRSDITSLFRYSPFSTPHSETTFFNYLLMCSLSPGQCRALNNYWWSGRANTPSIALHRAIYHTTDAQMMSTESNTFGASKSKEENLR